MKMLKLQRLVTQGVVVHPVNDPKETLTIRVLESVPGGVGLGFDGDGFRVIRSEIYHEGYGGHKDERNK
jgi:hypothetical protein|tara:strand:+ start:401 stop:607 length:207 start_codon:yes stop_codon:yes gene_type:complete